MASLPLQEGVQQPVLGHPGIAIAYSQEKGRHLVTTQRFKAGQLVAQEKAYVSVLYDDQVPHRCDFCFKAAPDLLRCGRSHHARYCSREHQKSAWSAGYKEECSALVAWAPRVPPPTIRLAARALWKARREQSKQKKKGELAIESGSAQSSPSAAAAAPLGSGTWAAVLQLLHHWEALEDERKATFAQMAAAARHFAAAGLPAGAAGSAAGGRAAGAQEAKDEGEGPAEDGIPGVKTVAQLLARFAANNHTICDAELRPLGSGIYPLMCLANHSCVPSCMQSFQGDTICFRALRDLSPGEEVTIAYVELGATRQQRREALYEQYKYDPESPGTPVHPNQASKLRPPPLASLHLSSATSSAGAATAAGSSAPGAPNISIRVFGSDAGSNYTPPWPCDPRDTQLSQLLLVTPGGSGPTGPIDPKKGGATCGGPGGAGRALLGGLEARVVQRSSSPQDDAARSFAGLHLSSSGLGGPEENEEEDEEGEAQVSNARQGRAGQHQQQQQQQQPGTVVEVDAWGPWAAAWAAQVRQSQEPGAPQGFSAQPTGLGPQGSGAEQGQQGQASAVGACATAMETDQGVGVGGGGGAGGPQSGSSPDSYTGPQLCLASLSQQLAGLLGMLQRAEHLSSQGAHGPAVSLLQEALRRASAGFKAPLVAPYPGAAATGQGRPGGQGPSSSSSSSGSASQGAAGAAGSAGAYMGGQQGCGEVLVALGPCHLLRMRLGAALLKAAIDEGSSWPVALQAAKDLVPVYELAYPSIWPNLGLHYATLAKLASFLEQPKEAMAAAEKAMRVLSITHSGWREGEAVIEQVARVRWECQQEMAYQQQHMLMQ